MLVECRSAYATEAGARWDTDLAQLAGFHSGSGEERRAMTSPPTTFHGITTALSQNWGRHLPRGGVCMTQGGALGV